MEPKKNKTIPNNNDNNNAMSHKALLTALIQCIGHADPKQYFCSSFCGPFFFFLLVFIPQYWTIEVRCQNDGTTILHKKMVRLITKS
jgi:hypothetical protein